jgi:hypothetical protein
VKKALKFIGWRKGEEETGPFYQDREIQRWQQQLSVLQNLEPKDREHLADTATILKTLHSIQRCLLLDALDLRMGSRRVYWLD